MPLYEYQCAACSHEFEMLVSRRDAEITCESCGSPQVEKLMSGFAFKSNGKFVSSHQGSCSGCSANSCSNCSGH